MRDEFERRDFLKLAALGGGVVFTAGLGLPASAAPREDFTFLQITDTHWGFDGPKVNPEAKTTLKRAVDAVNALPIEPDFIMFTGDLTHTTEDPGERRRRLAEFRQIVGGIRHKNLRFMPGEHDAALDRGEAYREFFGAHYYTFDHKGLHFIAVDNTTDPGASLGRTQLDWLAADLAQLDRDQPIVVFAHRPLYDLFPEWDWATRDGEAALALLAPYRHVTVFYGHIHQEHHRTVGQIGHHAAASLIFPLVAAGSQPKRGPVAWDPEKPFRGLGFRRVDAPAAAPPRLTELPLVAG